MLAGGGARLDGEAITDESYRIAGNCGELRVSSGKKKHGVLRQAG